MKYFFTFFILLVFLKSAVCQDTIVKINGDKIVAKISEISPTELKYKRFDFQDGPTYVESKSGIRYIRFSNGLKEEFSQVITISESPKAPAENSNADYYDPNAGRSFPSAEMKMKPVGAAKYFYQGRKIGEREMQYVLMQTRDKEIARHVQAAKDAHKLQFIGFAAIPLGIGSLIALTSSFNSYGGTVNGGYLATSGILLVGAIACPIFSGVFKHKRTTNNRQAVALYNQKY
jgi:hypothetical protein